MKRIISFILTLTMLVSMGAAFAVNPAAGTFDWDSEADDSGKIRTMTVELVDYGVERAHMFLWIPLTSGEGDEATRAYHSWAEEDHSNFEDYAKYSIKLTVPEGASETWYNEAIRNDVKVDRVNLSRFGININHKNIFYFINNDPVFTTEYFSFPSWDTVKGGGEWYLLNTATGSTAITATTNDANWVSEFNEDTCVWREEIYKFEAVATATIKSNSFSINTYKKDGYTITAEAGLSETDNFDKIIFVEDASDNKVVLELGAEGNIITATVTPAAGDPVIITDSASVAESVKNILDKVFDVFKIDFSKRLSKDEFINNFGWDHELKSSCSFDIKDVYSIFGRVVKENGEPEPEVSVVITQGTNITGRTTTADRMHQPSGTFLFENLPAGIYNVSVSKDGVTRTVLVEIKDSDVKIPDIVLPDKKTNSFVEVEDETDSTGSTGSGSSGGEDGESLEIVVGGVDDLFNDNDQVFSDADDVIVKDKGSVDLKIKVKKKNIQDKDNDDQQLDEEKDKTHHIGLYLEMGVSKEVKDKDGIKNEALSKDEIPDVGKLLQIVVKLPKGLREKSEYVVYRVHEGVTESMNPLEGDPMTYAGTEEGFFYIKDKDIVVIYARMFSTYGIGYEEAEQPSNNNTGSSGYSGPNLWYIGGNTFDTSTTQNPTKVEIDGKTVPFTMNGSKIVVGCVEPGAKWLTVHWGSSTNTVRFTPDANAYCTQTVIPKTGDMPLWAYIAVFFGF